MSDEWISFDKSLPKIDEEIEIIVNKKSKDIILPFKFIGKLIRSFDVFKIEILKPYIPFTYKEGDFISYNSWRPIKEKRPDFSKLRDGDAISVEFKNGEKGMGFFISIENCWFDKRIAFRPFSNKGYESQDGFKVSNIKKITRINIEKKTFEDI